MPIFSGKTLIFSNRCIKIGFPTLSLKKKILHSLGSDVRLHNFMPYIYHSFPIYFLVRIFLCSTILCLVSFGVTVKVIVFTVLDFSWQIMKLGCEISRFSKSTYPGLLKNVITFNLKWFGP